MPYQSPSYSEPRNPVGTVTELFAGVGGFRIGLARAGWKTVYSNQWEPATKTQHASEVYEARFGAGGHSNQDIANVSRFPAGVDLVVGGFPCQDYSVAKSRSAASGLAGKKGVLWWEILRLVKKHKPAWIFLENVDRLLKSPSSQPGRDFAIMLASLGSAGYQIEWRAVSAADYGLPQRRIRVLIVANRRSRKKARAEDVILADGVLAEALPVEKSADSIKSFSIDADLVGLSKRFNVEGPKSPFLNSGFFSHGVATTLKTSATHNGPKMTLGDVLLPDSDIPQEFWVSRKDLPKWQELKAGKKIPRVDKKTGYSYFYSEGSMAFPDRTDRPSRTILTAEGGTTPSRFKHIIETPSGFRRLTPVELERLSGFPDDWTRPPGVSVPITDAKRAFFMGNALVVGLVEMVGQELALRMQSGASLISR